MFDKFKKAICSIKSKHIARAVFALVCVAALLVGHFMLFEHKIVNGDKVFYIKTCNRNVDEVINSMGVTTETEPSVDGSTDEFADESQEPQDNEQKNNETLVLLPVQPTITMVYESETLIVKHGYKTVKSDKLYRGESKITTAGVNGEKQVTYLVTMVDGVVVSREVFEEKVTTEPVSQVETVGTKLKTPDAVMTSNDVKCISTLKPAKPIELDAKGQPVSYKKKINGTASAYCGKCDSNSTAVGLPARPGYVAVNPKQIPYYTKLYIVSPDGKTVYGYAMAADTGGFAYNGSGRVVDVRMPTGDRCNCGSNWGLKNVNIYILE